MAIVFITGNIWQLLLPGNHLSIVQQNANLVVVQRYVDEK